MKEKQTSKPAVVPMQNLNSMISQNLKKLIAREGLTQKELAEKLGIAAASMTDYCKGRRTPNIEFFVALKNLYDISIDDFLTKNIQPSAADLSPREFYMDPNQLITCRKYCGSYFVYYFDTGKYKGRDTQIPRESLQYGILCIYEKQTSLDVPEFGCAAVMSFNDRDSAEELKKTLDSFTDPSQLVDYINSNHLHTSYFGNFELSQEHAFISMHHNTTDKALIIFHRVDNNKPNYTGGIGTINSVSKGRERMPVVQFLGISRYPLAMSVEEIHHSLLLNYPYVKAQKEAQDLIRNFKALYLGTDSTMQGFSEYQKEIIIQSGLERSIRKILERNIFRYGKISGRDDDEWYHAIKAASIHEPAGDEQS